MKWFLLIMSVSADPKFLGQFTYENEVQCFLAQKKIKDQLGEEDSKRVKIICFDAP